MLSPLTCKYFPIEMQQHARGRSQLDTLHGIPEQTKKNPSSRAYVVACEWDATAAVFRRIQFLASSPHTLRIYPSPPFQPFSLSCRWLGPRRRSFFVFVSSSPRKKETTLPSPPFPHFFLHLFSPLVLTQRDPVRRRLPVQPEAHPGDHHQQDAGAVHLIGRRIFWRIPYCIGTTELRPPV